jgi:hypothetical protein
LLYELSREAYENPEPASFAGAFRDLRERALTSSLRCGRGYLETSPQGTFLAPAMAKAVPEIRFIHMVRDPRDVVRSGMRRRWYAGHANDRFRIVPGPGHPDHERWAGAPPFEKIAWLWGETNRWILDFTASLQDDRVLRLRAENIFRGDHAALERFYTFLGATCPPRHVLTRVLGRRLNAQARGDFPDPAAWTAGQQQALVKHCGTVAGLLGYPLDDAFS